MGYNDMWLRNTMDFKVFGVPLYIILLCGLAGVAVDIDHPVAYLLGIEDGRFLHIPLLASAGCIVFYYGAYITGLLVRMVLKK